MQKQQRRSRCRPSNRRAGSRRAGVLICVLACLVIVTGLVLTISKQALQARRETKHRLQVRQTELLLDAGIVRAARRLQSSPSYTGETWEPTDHRSVNAVDRLEFATVEIKVSDASEPSQKIVRVTASMGGVPSEQPVVNRTVQNYEFTFVTSKPDSTNAESDNE